LTGSPKRKWSGLKITPEDLKMILGGMLDGLALGLVFAGGALVGFLLSLPWWY
jgi:hypothetical protein